MTRKWFYRRAWAAQVEKGIFCFRCRRDLGARKATLCDACYMELVYETWAMNKEEPCQT